MDEESAFSESNSFLPFMALVLAFIAVHVLVELNTFWWRRSRIWKQYQAMFPYGERSGPLDAIPPSAAVLGDLELRHAWKYVHGSPGDGIEVSGNWFTLFPSQSDWLAATLHEDGLSFRNATSIFPAINALSTIQVPWDRILWANLRAGGPAVSALLELRLESIRTPEHDQQKVSPPQITAWLPISRGRLGLWSETLSRAGVKLVRIGP